jgi:protein involved in polysaccharide export with SLBB domain/beta-lactamase regulating signal transducer with metallopeptidase domain
MIELSSVIAAAVAESLLHFLWQGTLLGVLAFFLLRRAGTHARAKYALGIGTLAAMLLAPIVTTLWILFGSGSTGAVPTTASVQTMATSSLPVAWVLGVWACGVVVCGVRLAGGWVVARRMTTRAVKPVAQEIQVMATRVAERLSVTTPFRVLESTIAASPMMIGWLKPVVLLPTATLAGLSPSQLEALLAHEFAHIRRHDYLVNLLQSAIETLLFYHPAVWLVSRSVRESREQCCDDLTISVCDRLTYVSALSSVAALRTSSPALAAGGGSLRYRVERLLRPQSVASFSMGWLGVIPVALVLAAAMPMTSTAPVSALPQVGDIVAPAAATPPPSATEPAAKFAAPNSVEPILTTTVTTLPQAQPAPLAVRPALPVVLDFLTTTTQAMPLQAPPPPTTQQTPVRRVAVGDAVALEFYGLVDSDNDMRRRYVVGPDGTIQVKYAGAIMAAGKTLPEIAAAVLGGLQPKFYPDGVLQVAAVLGNDDDIQRVTVGGMVVSPGEKQLRGRQMTVARAIAAANGFIPSAGHEIEIRRLINGKAVTIHVTRSQLDSGDDPPLVADDIVTVKQGYVFFVNGEVHSPGQKIWSPGMTVARALAMASGATEAADVASGKIRRAIKEPGTGKIVRYTDIAPLLPQTEVLPDDTVLITRKKAPEPPLVFYVIGEVNAPGAKVWEPGMTVGKALSMSNGETPKGKLSHIERAVKDAAGKVIKKVQVKKLKDDTEILPDDVLVIARKWFGN